MVPSGWAAAVKAILDRPALDFKCLETLRLWCFCGSARAGSSSASRDGIGFAQVELEEKLLVPSTTKIAVSLFLVCVGCAMPLGEGTDSAKSANGERSAALSAYRLTVQNVRGPDYLWSTLKAVSLTRVAWEETRRIPYPGGRGLFDHPAASPGGSVFVQTGYLLMQPMVYEEISSTSELASQSLTTDPCVYAAELGAGFPSTEELSGPGSMTIAPAASYQYVVTVHRDRWDGRQVKDQCVIKMDRAQLTAGQPVELELTCREFKLDNGWQLTDTRPQYKITVLAEPTGSDRCEAPVVSWTRSAVFSERELGQTRGRAGFAQAPRSRFRLEPFRGEYKWIAADSQDAPLLGDTEVQQISFGPNTTHRSRPECTLFALPYPTVMAADVPRWRSWCPCWRGRALKRPPTRPMSTTVRLCSCPSCCPRPWR